VAANFAKVKAGCVYLCWVATNTVWSHTAGDPPWLCDGFPIKSYTVSLTTF